jgi:hypothetical protein
MKLTDLFAERFDTYFQAAQTGDPLWLFVHVPKTAGSSLNGEMVPILFPNHHIYIDYGKLDPSEVNNSYEALFDRSVDWFIGLAQAKRYRYCTGHINAAQVERIVAAVPNVRPVTLIRDPVSRFISDFRYQRSDMHPGHEQFRAAYPEIHDYLRLEGDWNKTATSLLPVDLRASGDAQACVDWLMSTYAFIGIQELYDLSLHALTWFAGKPKRSKVRKRINDPTPENEVVLTEELEQEIRERNKLDIALYDAIAPRFTAISESLASYLDRVAPRPPRP